MGLVDCTMSKGPADQTHHMKGRLHVEVVEARGLKDMDTWGKMSPACSVQIGNQFQRTKNRGHAGFKVWFEAAALSHVAFNDEFKDQLLAHGTVPALVRVLTLEGPTPGRLRNGAGAIANLVARNNTAALEALTTVEPLTDALKEICKSHETRESPDLVIVIEQLNRAIMNLAMEHSCAMKIAESEVAIPMLELVKHSTENAIKLSAAGALVNLSSDNDANLIVAKLTGGIPPHVRLLWANIGGDYEKVVMGAHDPSQIDTHDEMHAVHQSGGLPDHHWWEEC